MFAKIKIPDNVCHCFGLVANFEIMMLEGKVAVCICNELKVMENTASLVVYSS